MPEHVTYGPGGFDPDADDGNVVERFEVEAPAELAAEAPLAERVEALEEALLPEG